MVIGLNWFCIVLAFRVVWYALPRSFGDPAVVLLPGVNLYPCLSSLSSLPFAAYCWVRACLWRGCTWGVSSLCGVFVCVFTSLSVRCAPVFFFAFVAPFFVFLWCVWSFLVPLLRWFCLLVRFPLLSFRPRAALPWGFLVPLEDHILKYPSHRIVIWN